LFRQYKGKRDFIYFAYPFVVKDFISGYPAKDAGLLVDDRIVGINGMDLPYFDLFAHGDQKPYRRFSNHQC
jgi:C-terminal processing protease CtpA/Prc